MSQQPNNNLFAPLAVGFFIGVITIGTVVLVWNHDREPRRYLAAPASERDAAPTASPFLDVTSFSRLNSPTTPALDLAVARAAARFACSCGTCGEKRLDICSCETALHERAFIQNHLRNGRSDTEAAEAVQQKYGGSKS